MRAGRRGYEGQLQVVHGVPCHGRKASLLLTRLTGKHMEAGNSSSAGGAAVQPEVGGDGGDRSSAAVGVAGEVSALVAAATSVDKLSRMYEGWAPWL
jgi:hypothetical protein